MVVESFKCRRQGPFVQAWIDLDMVFSVASFAYHQLFLPKRCFCCCRNRSEMEMREPFLLVVVSHFGEIIFLTLLSLFSLNFAFSSFSWCTQFLVTQYSQTLIPYCVKHFFVIFHCTLQKTKICNDDEVHVSLPMVNHNIVGSYK